MSPIKTIAVKQNSLDDELDIRTVILDLISN